VTRIGGRPAQITTGDIVRVGREIGLEDLSMNAVATALGVSSTALYRHVDGRWGLEKLVGEWILADLTLPDDPDHDVTRHLLSFALHLRSFTLDHPGLAGYLQTLFPRGESGRALLTTAVQHLVDRGYSSDAAITLHSAVASIAIGLAADEEAQRRHGDEILGQREHVLAQIAADPALGPIHRDVPDITDTDYFRLVLTAAIRGLVAVGPPGRSAQGIIDDLNRESEGL
jgi:AcrR family transcriptional regulator